MSFNAIDENKIIAKISGFTVLELITEPNCYKVNFGQVHLTIRRGF